MATPAMQNNGELAATAASHSTPRLTKMGDAQKALQLVPLPRNGTPPGKLHGKREISAGAPGDRQKGCEEDDRINPRLRSASNDASLSYNYIRHVGFATPGQGHSNYLRIAHPPRGIFSVDLRSKTARIELFPASVADTLSPQGLRIVGISR